MNYQIRYSKIESSPALVEYIEDKLVATLKRLTDDDHSVYPTSVTIEVGLDTLHHRKGEIWFAEITGATEFGALRVRAEGNTIFEAIDVGESELKNTLSKSKGRFFSKSMRAARRVKSMMRLSRLARFFRRGRIRDEGM